MKRIAISILALMTVFALMFGAASAEQTVRCLSAMRFEADGMSIRTEFRYAPEGIIHACEDPAMEMYVRYDLQGRVAEEREIEDGETVGSTLYTYDNAGNLTEEKDISEGEVQGSTLYTYDEAAHLILKQMLGPDGANQGRWEYIYDAAGNLIRSGRPAEGKNQQHTEYFYDENGAMIRKDSYNSDGLLQYYSTYTYTADGKPLQQKEYAGEVSHIGSSGYLGCWDYTYDAAGRLLSRVWNAAQTAVWTNISEYYTYDEAGRLTRYTEVGFEVNTDIEYSYDDQGYLVAGRESVEGFAIYMDYEELTLADDIAAAADKMSREGAMDLMNA